MIAITGASGQLGRLVINALLKSTPANEIVALVRDPNKVADLRAQGVVVREADYDRPATLLEALSGIDKLLLISSNEVGQRLPQHLAVITAAKKCGVKLIAYTSILRAETSPLPLAEEHKATEAALAAAGIPFALLRNGWYSENYLASVPAALQYGVLLGSAGEGKIASAARADYAEAAAMVLKRENQGGRIYELAGDSAYTLNEFAQAVSAHSGKKVEYHNLPEVEFKDALIGAGLPDGLATLLAESDTGASKGGLFDDSKTLSELIGRPTTPISKQIAELTATSPAEALKH